MVTAHLFLLLTELTREMRPGSGKHLGNKKAARFGAAF
ncbi:hypothetical protein HY17_00575 [Hyphomonas sp. CY54-11-8]|nr:hypothetical protein HY17_00575 [Hyphomonas sp. CY54-11-8]RAN36717.1 hypothetical protein HY26_06820 [Hyphomonas sp. GM-8P]